MPTAQGVMLAVLCKRTDQVDIVTPITNYIKQAYSEREAREAADDLMAVSQLRSEIASAPTSSNQALKEPLIKYYRSLISVETRFPISNDKSGVKLNFYWYDAFRTNKRYSQYNIHFEKAGILFNIAAVLSQQGLAADRTTPEGLKIACNAFQESAGTFQTLKEVSAKTDANRSVDVSPECCAMLEKLMLTQAQECAYHSAVLGSKSPAVLARLAKQVCIMYEEAGSLFAHPLLQQHFDKSWLSHVQMKASLYDVEALNQQGRQLHSQDKISHEIATLQEAFKRIQNTKKVAKSISTEMADSVRVLQESIQVALTKAERDNASIYLERVPAFGDLPPIQGALLVKATQPAGLDSSGEQLFSTLVPDSSAKALSRYTDMVDALAREQQNKLASATDTARMRLQEWELPETLNALDGRSTIGLPDALAAELAEMASTGGVQHLKGILTEIGEIRRVVEEDLTQCDKILNEDARQDAEMRNKWGDKWTPPPSTTLTKHFWEKIASYRTTLKQAADSDTSIIKKLTDGEAAYASLTPEGVVAQLPRLQAPLVNVSAHDPAQVVASLRRNLEALQQNAVERAGIEEALKETKQKDNILPKLMSCVNPESLFTLELKKYDTLVADAAKNAARNEQLLNAIAQDNQAFRQIFEVAAWRGACDAAAGGVRQQVRSFKELMDHLSEGLRFYLGIQDTVKTHLNMCNDYACSRTLQRDDLSQDLERRKARDEASEREAQRLAAMSMNQAPAAYPPQPHTNPYTYPPAAPPASQQPSPYSYQTNPPAAPPSHNPYAPAPPPPTPTPTAYQPAAPGAPQPPAAPHYGYQPTAAPPAPYQAPPPAAPYGQQPYGAPYQAPPPAHAPPPGQQPQQQQQQHPFGPLGWIFNR